MRGVHHPVLCDGDVVEGSSPHARGPRWCREPFPDAAGIIPACAGSTQRRLCVPIKVKDHPRMRGVHGDVSNFCFFELGSSPHARGPPFWRSWSAVTTGIIPACAGSTDVARVPALSIQDHPRMRGVHPWWLNSSR